jgi:hypothetical protein
MNLLLSDFRLFKLLSFRSLMLPIAAKFRDPLSRRTRLRMTSFTVESWIWFGFAVSMVILRLYGLDLRPISGR